MPIINQRLRAVMKGHPCYDKQEKCSIIACRCSPYCIGKYIPSAVLGSFLSTPFSMLHLIGIDKSRKFLWPYQVPALSPIGKLFWRLLKENVLKLLKTQRILHRARKLHRKLPYSSLHSLFKPWKLQTAFLQNKIWWIFLIFCTDKSIPSLSEYLT